MRPTDRPEIEVEYFRGSDALEAGALTQMELRTGPYRRLFHGIYAAPGVEISHELRCRAATLLCAPESVLTGRSAATVRGLPLAMPLDPVELIVPVDCRPRRRRGLLVRSVRIRSCECLPWQRIRIARPERVAFDLLATPGLGRAVGAVDALLRAGLIEWTKLGNYLHDLHDDGVVRARQAFALLDPRAESPRESELRVLLRLAGLPAEPQFEIELGPSWRVYADLAYPDEMLIVEYDGAWHGAPERVQADQRRRDALRAAGWAVLVFTDSDFHGNPNMIVETVSEALTAARARRRQ